MPADLAETGLWDELKGRYLLQPFVFNGIVLLATPRATLSLFEKSSHQDHSQQAL